MRIYKTRRFSRWANGEGLSDRHLREAAEEMESGLIDAVLGGHLVKKRIGGPDRGKRGAFRTIIAYKAGDRAFFIYGFPKNEKDNISDKELAALKKLSRELFGYDDKMLDQAVKGGALLEVKVR